MARDAANDLSKRLALVKLHTKVVERWFLLCVKAKYADGHALDLSAAVIGHCLARWRLMM